jgi:hypothetical protein
LIHLANASFFLYPKKNTCNGCSDECFHHTRMGHIFASTHVDNQILFYVRLYISTNANDPYADKQTDFKTALLHEEGGSCISVCDDWSARWLDCMNGHPDWI